MAANKRITTDIADTEGTLSTGTNDRVPESAVGSIEWNEIHKIVKQKHREKTHLNTIALIGGNIINAGRDFESELGHLIGVHVDENINPYIVWSNGLKEEF